MDAREKHLSRMDSALAVFYVVTDVLLFALLALGAMVYGCSKAPAPTPASSAETVTYDQVADRLPGFLSQGFAVSLRGAEAVNQGDSLLFTGLAVYGLDCARSQVPADALRAMLAAETYYRFPGDTDALSLDGLLGLYRGIAARVTRCNDLAWTLPPEPAGALVPGFDYVRDLLAYRLGKRGAPTQDRQAALELEIGAWALAVDENHEAAYRIHLGLIALQTIQELGRPVSSVGRSDFCAATAGADMPTLDAWCGRQDLGAWLDGFTYDLYQYRHQRSGAWEHPDGGGDAHPAIDYLVAFEDKTAS